MKTDCTHTRTLDHFNRLIFFTNTVPAIWTISTVSSSSQVQCGLFGPFQPSHLLHKYSAGYLDHFNRLVFVTNKLQAMPVSSLRPIKPFVNWKHFLSLDV